MALSPGSHLGSFEIVGALGAGGMGEVYRARDTKLDRHVALKILPESFASDPDRLMRFEREAKTLASLNHPHIAQIHGMEGAALAAPSSGTEVSRSVRVLIMELVDGEDLSQRISRGPIPLDEAVPIAKQIAEALEAAHDAGIVHRDLKPANIKVRDDGTVKVLDFGLAKTGAAGATGATGATGAVTSPAMTQAGLILGTAAYMSPEQAKGKPVDKRADIWAFGCVVFEMITGRRAFDGEDVTDTIVAVMSREPDWNAWPASAPSSLKCLIQQCLQKDLRKRWRHAGDLLLQLDTVTTAPDESTTGSVTPGKSARLAWVIAALTTVALIASVVAQRSRAPADPAPMRVDVVTRPASNMLQLVDFALSPDGRKVVFNGGAEAAPLWIRSFDGSDARPLRGTEDARFPFWSPDGRSIGFFASGKLKRLEIDGGQPVTLADATEGIGGTWNERGVILYAPALGQPLMRVAASGGAAEPVTRLEPRHMGQGYPHFLPDGVRFLFHVVSAASEVHGLYLGSMEQSELRRVEGVPAPVTSHLALLPPDRVAFLLDQELQIQRIDFARAALVGTAESVASGVAFDPLFGRSGFSIAANGTIAYRTGEVTRQLAWVDRTGRLIEVAGAPDRVLVMAAASPDGTRFALDLVVENNRDIWVRDALRGSTVRLTFGKGAEGAPVWSPDGTRIAYESDTKTGRFNLFMKPVSGEGDEVHLLPSDRQQWPLDWSRDGNFLLYFEGPDFRDADLFALPMTGDNRKPMPVATSKFAEVSGSFSPDGHWVAYQTTESGRSEIVVQGFPDRAAGRTQVSTNGGKTPQWSADGREVYYVAPDGKIMAVSVAATAGGLTVGVPVALFQTAIADWYGLPQYDVDNKGRFLVPMGQEVSPPLTLLLNWKPK